MTAYHSNIYKLIATLIAILCTGCPLIIAEHLAEKSKQAIKAHQDEMKTKRLIAKKVEGTVKQCSMRDINVLDVDAEIVTTQEISEPEDKNGTLIKVNSKIPDKKAKEYTITFTDGREISFTGIPQKPIEEGRYYTIEYNGLQEITNVTETTP